MKRLMLYLGLLMAFAGLWELTRGSLIAVGVFICVIVVIRILYKWRDYKKRYRPKHVEEEMNNDIVGRQLISETRHDGAGVETMSRSSGLVAKPSLIEAIGRGVIDSQNLKTIGERTLDYLSRYFRAETFLFLSRETGNLHVLAARGPRTDDLIGVEYELDQSLATVIAKNEPVYLNMPNISTELNLEAEEALTGKLASLGNVSLLFMGVGSAGLLALASGKPDSFTKLDEAALEGVAVQLSYIIENIKENQALRQSVTELDKLLNFINKANVGGDLSETLMSALKSAIELSGADSGSFFLFNEEKNKLVLKTAVGLPDSALDTEINIGEGISGWVADHRNPVMIKDIGDKAASAAGLGPDKIAVAMALPVMLDDRFVGVLNLGAKNADHDFAPKNLTRGVRLLGQVGVAITAGESGQEWESLYLETIRAITKIIESRDPFKQGHSFEVAKYAVDICAELKLGQEETRMIEIAGLLHDIGSAGISDAVFRLDKPLSSVERLLIRSHPKLAVKALEDIPRLRGVLPLILHHHESYDGSGYAEGLKGDEIPTGARVLRVAEAYAAMTADRPYRRAKTKSEALDELRAGAGNQFDPRVVEALAHLMDRPYRTGH